MKDLLFQLIQYPFDPQKKDRLKVLLYQVQDWNKTVELINAHGIIALAAYNIKEAGLEKEVPPDAMAIAGKRLQAERGAKYMADGKMERG